MFRHLSYFPSRLVVGAISACMLAAVSLPAQAQLLHQYTFNNGNAVDSVGGQDGTVVNPSGTFASFVGGRLDLSANNGQGSNQDFSLGTTQGAYLDLPNSIFTNAVKGGTFGQVTIEAWFTVAQNRTWAQFATFGTSNNGEDTSSGGDTTSYIALIPQSGTTDNYQGPLPVAFRATTKVPGGGNETFLVSEPALSTGVRHHVVLTLDQAVDFSAGAYGTAKLYLNNAAPIVQPIHEGLFLDEILDNNNWLGRSQWGDPLFDGSIDEFRIYGNALSATDVNTSFSNGPVPAALPVLVVNRDTGAVSISNPSGSGITLKGYSIGSAAGSLDPTTWTSIDAGNVFDSNGTWTPTLPTNSTHLAESVTSGTLDGGLLAAGTSRGIGLPWEKSPFEDLTFSFTLGDNSVGSGLVQYTGTAISRSDLNGDGSISAADWALFVPNSYKTFTGESQFAAYMKGDLDGDLDNDYFDFKLFKADYIAANGLEAFAALGAVPEPSSVILLTCAAACALGSRRR